MYLERSAPYYDRIYASQGKDYRREVEYLESAIRARGSAKRQSLLDVACGTGSHLVHLRPHFDVEGVDVSLDFIRIARSRLPKVRFHVGDMRTFSIGTEYDCVTCLFSSIGFMDTSARLHSAVRNMARHLRAGGLLIIEPWFAPGQIVNGKVSMTIVDEEGLKLVRMSTTRVEGSVSSFDFHYLLGTSKGTEHFVEKHRMGLYTNEEMMECLEKNGFSAEYDEKGPTGRGLWIGKKRAPSA